MEPPSCSSSFSSSRFLLNENNTECGMGARSQDVAPPNSEGGAHLGRDRVFPSLRRAFLRGVPGGRYRGTFAFCFVSVLSCVGACLVLFWSSPRLVLSRFGPCLVLSRLVLVLVSWLGLARSCLAFPCLAIVLRRSASAWASVSFRRRTCHACRVLLSPRRCRRLYPGSPKRGTNHTARYTDSYFTDGVCW